MRRVLMISVAALLALTALVYVVDTFALRVRIKQNANPYGSVTVEHYFAVHQKNGKIEYLYDPPQPKPCVHAIFPHGVPPCWYLERHPEQREEITSLRNPLQ